MTTPAGLQRFTRSMPTRYKGSCLFCTTTTTPGTDMAALSQGKWINVCLPCSQSITAQVRAVLVRADAAQAGLSPEVISQVADMLPNPQALASTIAGEAAENVAYDVLVKLQGMLTVMLAAATPVEPVNVDPRGALLRAIADNGNASPRDRDFAGSLADWVLVKGRDLTPGQAPHADRLIAKYATGTPVAAAPVEAAEQGLYAFDNGQVRKVYMTQNNRIACKLLHVHGDHGAFEYEKGGTRTVTTALANGTAHRMTQDEAAAFGRLHSFCCNCARDLDDDRSVAAGYGPTCAANMGWFYPTYEQAAAILGRPVTTPTGKVIEPPAA